MQVEPKPEPPRLENPVRLTEQVWPNGTVPVASVFCITYNHEKFIRDAIEGFLMQETTFPVEIFIHDDASTDGTATIVKEYAAKYPQLFWSVLQTENQWSKGNAEILSDYLAQQRGKFVALCEGDDYWTDCLKLNKQVDLLDRNPQYTLCHHRVAYKNEITKRDMVEFPEPAYRINNLSGKLLVERNFIQTCAAMLVLDAVRSTAACQTMSNMPLGDWPLFSRVTYKRSIAYLDECMAVYRIHSNSYWSALSQCKREKLSEDMARQMMKCRPIGLAYEWWKSSIKTAEHELAQCANLGAIRTCFHRWSKLLHLSFATRLVFVLPTLASGLNCCWHCVYTRVKMLLTKK